ncbi:MAG: hypothetical protein ACRDZ5_07500, partial [Acidimicrobiales bacterium]
TVAFTSASHPLEASQRSFFTAVENRDPSLVACTPADAARSLAVALAAEKALEEGRKVPVESL